MLARQAVSFHGRSSDFCAKFTAADPHSGQVLIPTVSLANGAEMQRLALGLYNVPRDQVKAWVYHYQSCCKLMVACQFLSGSD